jgi:hypothetical protein
MTNPTSNFNWQMPTSSDLVTDLPADFAVFGQAVDTTFAELKGGTTGQVLAKASNTDMDFVWSTDATGMTNPMTTTGDMIYSSSGSTPARRGIGTTGQILTVSGGVPTWATPAGGGKVLQVVTATSASSTYSQSSTYSDVSGASCSITPSATTSKVLVMAFLPNIDYRNSTSAELDVQMTDGSNNLITMAAESYGYPPANQRINTAITVNWLHSPATTSAFTYKFRMRSKGGVNGVYVNNGSGTYISIILLEIGA